MYSERNGCTAPVLNTKQAPNAVVFGVQLGELVDEPLPNLQWTVAVALLWLRALLVDPLLPLSTEAQLLLGFGV